VFSLVPRCQGRCGSQEYTFTLVATVAARSRPLAIARIDFPKRTVWSFASHPLGTPVTLKRFVSCLGEARTRRSVRPIWT
jgi:hypothetical protein